MPEAPTQAISREADTLNAVKSLCVFRECSDELQKCVLAMIDVICSPETDDDERDQAIHTIAECLFPEQHKDAIGIDLEHIDSEAITVAPEVGPISNEMDEQERSFAQRLSENMQSRGFTQTTLAERAGVGQPAISMMLNRNCRPQRRTVAKLAEALGVKPEELWLEFSDR